MSEQYIESAVTDPETAEHLAHIGAVRSRLEKEGRTGERAPKYYIQTFGCQQNEADSERLAGLCAAMGYVKTDLPGEAELILVNTCAVREHAEKKALSIIGSYKHIKDRNPAVIIGVGGCMVTQKARADKLKNSYPYVSFTFDTGAADRVPELVRDALNGKGRSFVLSEEWKIAEGLPIRRESKHMAWLSIVVFLIAGFIQAYIWLTLLGPLYLMRGSIAKQEQEREGFKKKTETNNQEYVQNLIYRP